LTKFANVWQQLSTFGKAANILPKTHKLMIVANIWQKLPMIGNNCKHLAKAFRQKSPFFSVKHLATVARINVTFLLSCTVYIDDITLNHQTTYQLFNHIRTMNDISVPLFCRVRSFI